MKRIILQSMRSMVLLMLLFAVMPADALLAALTGSTWTGGTGVWSDAANWSSAIAPNNGVDTYLVFIDGNNIAMNASVTLDTNVTVDRLTLDLGDTLTFLAGKSLDAQVLFHNSGDVFLANGSLTGNTTNVGYLSSTFGSLEGVNNTGTIDANSTLFNGHITNTGSINLTGASGAFYSTTLDGGSGGSVIIDPSGSGLNSLDNTSTLNFSGLTTFSGGGRLSIAGINATTNTGTSSGELSAEGVGTVVEFNTFTLNGGTLSSDGDATFHLQNAVLKGAANTGNLSSFGGWLEGVNNTGTMTLDSTALNGTITNTGAINFIGSPSVFYSAALDGGIGGSVVTDPSGSVLNAQDNTSTLDFSGLTTFSGGGRLSIAGLSADTNTGTNTGELRAEGVGTVAEFNTFTLNGGTLSSDSDATFHLQNAALKGAANTGNLSSFAGWLEDVNNTGTMTLDSTALNGTITNTGVINFIGNPGVFYTANLNGGSGGSVVTDPSGSVLNAQDNTSTLDFSGLTTFSGGGRMSIAGINAITNTGTNTGELRAEGVGTVAEFNTFTLNGGTLSSDADATFHLHLAALKGAANTGNLSSFAGWLEDVNNTGTMTLDSTALNGTITNTGVINLIGNPGVFYTANLNGGSGGSVVIDPSGSGLNARNNTSTLDFSGLTTFSGGGRLSIAGINATTNTGTSSGELRAVGAGTVAEFNTFTLNGGTLSSDWDATFHLQNAALKGAANTGNLSSLDSLIQNVNNTGVITAADSTFAGETYNQGSIIVNSGNYAQGDGDTTVLDGGSINAPVVDINGGVLKGSGTVEGKLNISETGLLVPGNSTGIIDVYGDFKFSGLMEMELGGTDILLNQYDQINVYDYISTTEIVEGTASFGGKIEVSLWNEFMPGVGDYFDIITADDILGTEISISYLGNASNYTFDSSFLTFADRDVFRLTVTGLPDGTVPEPTSLLLLGSGLAGLCLIRRKSTATEL